ncbi:hypothetical protein ANN_08444 [Periplaneta americana]|uniref:Uncharacterized protein n=1 Tax=Periplaneta americana TaxID=6978 RepID=A0ABQ8T1F7_PERAM|nr:hypothetical protein ANN_08444 [Periplaneta americana]
MAGLCEGGNEPPGSLKATLPRLWNSLPVSIRDCRNKTEFKRKLTMVRPRSVWCTFAHMRVESVCAGVYCGQHQLESAKGNICLAALLCSLWQQTRIMNKKEANLRIVGELRKRIADVTSQGKTTYEFACVMDFLVLVIDTDVLVKQFEPIRQFMVQVFTNIKPRLVGRQNCLAYSNTHILPIGVYSANQDFSPVMGEQTSGFPEPLRSARDANGSGLKNAQRFSFYSMALQCHGAVTEEIGSKVESGPLKYSKSVELTSKTIPSTPAVT